MRYLRASRLLVLFALFIVPALGAGPAVAWEVVEPAVRPDPLSSDLAANARGDNVVVFTGRAAAGFAVFARSRARAGGPWGHRVRISGVTAGRPGDLRVAVDGTGRALVAWRRPVTGGGELRYAIRPSATGAWERDRTLVSATSTAIASPALAFADGRGTYAWGEVGAGGWQVRRATLDLASATPRAWSADAPLALGVIPSVAVAPSGATAAIGAATGSTGVGGGSGGPVIATTRAAGAVAWEAPVTLDAAGTSASIAIAGDGPVVAAWQRTPRGIVAAVREGLAGTWGAPEQLAPDGFGPVAAAGTAGHALVAYGVSLDDELGPDPASNSPRGEVLRTRRRAPGGTWGTPQTVFAVADGRFPTLQRADDVRAAVDSLGTSLLAWHSVRAGLNAPWAVAAAAAGPFPAPVEYPTSDDVEQISLAPSGQGEALVTWVADSTGPGRSLRSDRVPTGACATLPERPPPSPPDAITLSATQLRINQRIYAAAIRRAGALDAWLGARVRTDDLCGGTVGAWALGGGIDVGAAPDIRQVPTASPRPVLVPPAPVKPGVVFTLSADQLRINQRIASRAVREANALLARLDGGLSGGDLSAGAVTAARLQATIAVAGSHASTPTPPTRTIVAPATRKAGVVVTVSAAQLRINQRIGQAAILRLNAARDRLLDGISGDEFRPDTLTSADLAP